MINNRGLIEESGGFENGTLTNQGQFNNQGTLSARIINSGEINNDTLIVSQSIDNLSMGVINNSPVGTISLYGDMNNAATINHSGELQTNAFMQTINNSGVFNNNGQFSSFSALQLINSGQFINNTSVNLNGLDSGITNSGAFENNGIVEVEGNLLNTETGVFNNIIGWATKVRGNLDNQGVFKNQTNLKFIDSNNSMSIPGDSGVLNNSGVFNNYGTVNSTALNGLSLNNSGEFNNNGLF